MRNIETGALVRAVRGRSKHMQPENHLVGAYGTVQERKSDGAGVYYSVVFDFGDSTEVDFICENCLEVL